MKCKIEGRKTRAIGLLAAALTLGVMAPAKAQDATKPAADLPTPSALMEKHIEAIGGKDLISKFRSRRMTGAISIPSREMSGTMEMISAAPNKMLMSMDITGLGRNSQGYNGTVGWAINDMLGPMLLEGEMLEQTARDAEFYGELKYTELYATLETVGEVDFADQKAFKVRQVAKSGQESFGFFNKETGLLIGNETIAESPMGEVPITIVLSDYKEFDGLMLPSKTTINQMGMEIVITIEKLEHDTVDDTVFEIPEEIKALIKAGQADDDGGPVDD